MRDSIRRAIVTGAAVLTIAYAAAPADYLAEGRRWWSHIQYLADDKLEGRDTGSAGHKLAAQYVAGEFERTGLKPAGTSGYIQPVKLEISQIEEAASSLELIRDGKAQPLTLGEDAAIALRSGAAPAFEGGAVFAGYGFAVPEQKYDELRGLDVRGKIVVYLTGGPKNIPGELMSHYQSAEERWKHMHSLGAAGTVVIANPKSMDVPWERAALSRFMPTMNLADSAAGDSSGVMLSLRFNAANADKLFAGTGHSIREILAAADSGQTLPKFPLAVRIRSKVSVKKSATESQNVAGILPGADPKLKGEYVVVSAHLDHIGVGNPIGGDSIYNGAMDDASGIASVLEIARFLSREKLKRSVLFLAVTGEEKGLQGSRFFAAHPTVKLSSIVADINMDMFLPLYPLKYLVVYGLDESTLGDQMKAVAADAGVVLQKDPEPERNIFIRSDQYSFIKQGVPALFFKFGNLPGSPEDKMAKEWLRLRYHAPSDDLNQPVDLAAAAHFNELIRELTIRAANSDVRPAWKPESFFRRFQK
ncbi:MAG: M28 family peptidase [Bryobacteraceae bacterium]